MSHTYDYLIVGAGAAGCALAARLSEKADNRVLILEAGSDLAPGDEPADVLDPFPTSFYNRAYFWPNLKATWHTNHEHGFSQGRIMGGGGSVMGMMAMRGTPGDYDAWRSMGAEGWGWDDVLPYFCKAETDADYQGDLHGRNGPLPIRRVPREEWPPLSQAITRMVQARGDNIVDDMNGDFRDGLGRVPMCNTTARRANSALDYLDAKTRARPNLTIETGAHVTRVTFEGKRATGVEAKLPKGMQQFSAREVILSAGAIFSPTILMRSGVGDATQLAPLGIDVVADLKGVGRNLQNHPALYVGFHLRPEARQQRSLRTNPTAGWRFSSNLPGCPSPDLFINIQSKSSWNDLGERIGNLTASLVKPFSRGAVGLDPKAPQDMPKIAFNSLSDERDLTRMMMVFTRVVEIAFDPHVRPLLHTVFPTRFTDKLRFLNDYSRKNAFKTALFSAALDYLPGLSRHALGRLTDCRMDLRQLVADREALAAYCREYVAGSFHPGCSCRMGPADDPMSVTDACGRVRGMDGLRVADASIMPILPAGNTFLPTLMIGEKIAAHILAGN